MICDTRGGIVEVLPLTLASRRLLRQPKDLGKLNGCSLGAALATMLRMLPLAISQGDGHPGGWIGCVAALRCECLSLTAAERPD